MFRTFLAAIGFTFFLLNPDFSAALDTGAAAQLGLAADSSTVVEPAAPAAPARVGRDLTPDFNAAWETADQKLGQSEKAELREYKVLLVRGFMTGGYVEPFALFGKKVWVGRYFNDQMEVLKELGVEYSMVDIDSVMMPAHNAAKVAAEIRASAKPVIIISHSDGGMYALQALIENPELAPRVRGFISLQTPFLGSPVADYVLRNKALAAAMSKTLGYFGGSLEALASLSQSERAAFLSRNGGDIRRVVSSVRVISFATLKPDLPGKIDTLLGIPRDAMLKSGIANDGLVPTDSAILPGSDFVRLSGLDHIAPVMAEDMFLKFDRARMTKTLLLMILSK